MKGCTAKERAAFYASQHGGPAAALDTDHKLDWRAHLCLLEMAIKELRDVLVDAPD